ncbi:hypothetical protein ASD50_15675 [Mesorhizobium sp. Root552]|uniref:ABC transporter substrate-binding protein n=1 Tax=Mesorhizobium sp. Root552 TaxID=1736555 RepID=UPI0006FA5910|nr:hypothetical protein [Mesorhizobium sp. Root552]KQZ31286.1 hypothetical protein ASD50_15675 [Mesorhizobium sp. Root552]
MSRISTASYIAIAAFMMMPVSAHAEGSLAIFNWGDYISEEMVKKFEAKYDVKVTVDTYDSNETMLAKLKSGITGYDLAVPGDYMVEILIKEGLIEKVEPNTFENTRTSSRNGQTSTGTRAAIIRCRGCGAPPRLRSAPRSIRATSIRWA